MMYKVYCAYEDPRTFEEVTSVEVTDGALVIKSRETINECGTKFVREVPYRIFAPGMWVRAEFVNGGL